MSPLSPLTFERTIAAPPEEIFRAFTHPTALRDWLANDASAQPRPGGFLFLFWNDGYSATCTITHFEPPNALGFDWHSPQDPGPSQVRLVFGLGKQGTRLKLVHSGFGEVAVWEQNRKEKERAWEASLENLELFLLQGVDLRLARRPRLGIWMDDLTPQIATRLGLTVSQGVLLAGTSPGSGAQAAGLQKDDVLVSMNGVPLLGPPSFEMALKGLAAGDKPVVEYYRGGQKFAILLELGRFPIMPLPESPAVLAAAVRQTNERILQAISGQVSELSEIQAARRPQEKEWSVKEIIGHFILTEREYQSWAANMLRDNVVFDLLEFRPNVDERIASLLERFTTLRMLLAELAAAQEETADLLENLPESFITWRKHLYRRLVGWTMEVTPGHLDEEHAEQLRTTIEAAK